MMIGIDQDAKRFEEVAKQFGADHIINSSKGMWCNGFSARRPGADIVVETASWPVVFPLAIEVAAAKGRVSFGLSEATVSPLTITRSGLQEFWRCGSLPRYL